MNKKESEASVKEIEKKEKKCPFSHVNFRCEDCRLFQVYPELEQKMCSINYTALRSF